jgi:hypothetical protein
MNAIRNIFLDDQDDDLKNEENNDVPTYNDDIGENSEQTPLAKAVTKNEEKAADKEAGWANNRPGATNEDKDDLRVPTVTPDNDNLLPGPDED